MWRDTLKNDFVELQAELERTRMLLRHVLLELFDEGAVLNRTSALSEWWQEEQKRKVAEG